MTEAREFWKIATTFPPNKEEVYPEHAVAHNFDGQAAFSKATGLPVLEYGCGGGSDTLSLLRRGATVVATDIVPENVQTTLARGSASFSDQQLETILLQDSTSIIDFDPASFVTINCHGVLHHMPAQTMIEVLDIFYDLLTDGGVLYAMLYTEHLFDKCEDRVRALIKEGKSPEEAFSVCTDGGGLARWYTEGEGIAVFEERGFVVEHTALYNNDDFRVFWCRRPQADDE